MTWTGRVLSALPVLMLALSGVMKIAHNPQAVEGFTGKYGWQLPLLTAIGVVELLCAIIYAIPQTAVLGAVLVAGYLGGATATEMRIGGLWFMPALLGVFAWGGLFLRDPRLRALLPLRR
jgi:hypothetical protein